MNTSYPDVALLLAVHNPGPHLKDLITGTIADGLDPTRIVVVDDGSGPSAEPELSAIRSLGCPVLIHPTNQGKGVALKTGFRYVRTTLPGLDVISADADGQHHPQDVRRIAERTGRGLIVLGTRPFAPMPLRSRFGNTVTHLLFRAATGRDVSDTQTGLRAYPADLLERFEAIEGERFEYEMNVLLDAAAASRPMEEVAIPARYLNGNAASHFGGLADSIRIYRPLLRYAFTSLLTRRAR
ncbi:glycosyltransferase family 2 protein [Actinoplanes awajinensis]|uniref:Glycosyltransferase 2-like domain-containing protein n=1 Tax=Actinoplanes awajinensis subsp. mycoplanecinus TaxID=135947 RepID=A0A117MNQ7_9ACTN|nr:glycosyltransferase family 2 protein [Actinoplanes awajinensis]KUL27552.1 hypothetical protein ADL15_35240 [Actinoplanes awajinensis subsp. mycoplanecinus]